MESNTHGEGSYSMDEQRPTWLPDGYVIVTEQRPAELPAGWTVIAKTNDLRNKRYLSPGKTTKCRYISHAKEHDLKKRGGPSMGELCDSLSHHGSDVLSLGSSILGRHHRLMGEIKASEDYIGWLSGQVRELELEVELKRQNDGA